MIHFDNVSKRYAGGHEALNGLSFGVAAGEMVFVTGHSGAGKTTLLKLLGLIERPTRGEIVVNGAALARVRQRAIPQVRRGIGMVFQNHRLLMDRSVFDNVALPLTIAGAGTEETAKRVRASLDKVGLLDKERSAPARAASAAFALGCLDPPASAELSRQPWPPAGTPMVNRSDGVGHGHRAGPASAAVRPPRQCARAVRRIARGARVHGFPRHHPKPEFGAPIRR